jgi:hypothetical protein
VQLAQLICWDYRWGTRDPATALGLLVCGAGALVAWAKPRYAVVGLTLVITGHALAGAMTISSAPRPIIDVWHFQQESLAALFDGRDPYAVRYRDVYARDLGFYGPSVSVDGWLRYSYPYPPLMLLLGSPGHLLGDVRWAHLIALELSAILIFASGRGCGRAVLAASMLLLTPRSLLVVKAGWTEPMVLLTVSGVIFCVSSESRRRWLWLPLGLLLGIKQYAIFAIPLVPLLFSGAARWRNALRTLAGACAVAGLITLPFVLMNPQSFTRSVVIWQFRQPFRDDALSFAAMFAHVSDWQAGTWLSLLAAGAATGLAWSRPPRDAAGFAASLALVMCALFATSKQAFCNYYFLVIGMTCAAAAIAERVAVTSRCAISARRPAAEATVGVAGRSLAVAAR